MWTVLNPVLKLNWFRHNYPSDVAGIVRDHLFQAVSAFNFVKPL